MQKSFASVPGKQNGTRECCDWAYESQSMRKSTECCFELKKKGRHTKWLREPAIVAEQREGNAV